MDPIVLQPVPSPTPDSKEEANSSPASADKWVTVQQKSFNTRYFHMPELMRQSRVVDSNQWIFYSHFYQLRICGGALKFK